MIKSRILAKLIFKIRIPALTKCKIDSTAKVGAGSVLSRVKMGRFSYTGSDVWITDAEIGNFCSIAGNVSIGGGIHPIGMISTSPVFLKGKNCLRKNFSKFEYCPSETVIIGNDVWIGEGVYIKAGVRIGTGAIIGAHAVVTHDVAPYTVVAGVPARVLKRRFDDETCEKLLEIGWWNWTDERLEEYANAFENPDDLIRKVERK